MSSGISRSLHNSVLQTANGVATTGLNFILMFFYAHFLGPEPLGRLVTAQAHVLAGIAFVDLGLTAGLITALHRTPSFHRVAMLRRVFAIRCLGALAVTTTLMLIIRAQVGDRDWIDLAYSPYLFGYALQYTLTSALVFSGYLGRTVFANLIGTLTSVAMGVFFALRGASVKTLLLSQCWGGVVAALIQLPTLLRELRKEGGVFAKDSTKASDHQFESVFSLFKEVWPSAIVFAVMAFSARIDQIIAADTLGYTSSGLYALSVRLVAIPALVASSIQFALFSDLQKLAISAPDMLATYASTTARWFFRHGGWISGAILALGGGVTVLLLPKFRLAIELLPWFIPGVWAQFIYNGLIGCLFGRRLYREIAITHVGSLVVYLLVLKFLTVQFGLRGAVLAFDIFTILLAAFSVVVLKRAAVLSRDFKIWAPFSWEERKKLGEVYRALATKFSSRFEKLRS